MLVLVDIYVYLDEGSFLKSSGFFVFCVCCACGLCLSGGSCGVLLLANARFRYWRVEIFVFWIDFCCVVWERKGAKGICVTVERA